MRKFLKLALPLFLLVIGQHFAKAQTTLSAGDIAFTGYQSFGASATTDEFSFVLLTNVTAGTVINFTDNGWLSTNVFRTGETTVTWTAATALSAGTEVKIVGTTPTLAGAGNPGTVTGTALSLSATGDQILAYQGSSGSPTFITAIHMNVYSTTNGDPVTTTAAAWDGTANTFNSSALPTGLTNGVNCIWIGTQGDINSEKDNAHFICAGNLSTAASIKALIFDQTKWATSDGDPSGFTLPTACSYITVVSAPTINTPPSSTSICAGANASFSITATGATNYQWQVDNGGGFTNITNNAIYSGATATTLNVTAVPFSFNTYQYRCVASNGSGSTNSSAATLTVTALPTTPSLLAKTPATGTVADGTNVSATFNAGSGGTGCSDDFRYTTNGGASYLPYTPGSNISTTGLAAGSGIVTIEGRRANCSAGCQGNYVVLASWIVTPLPVGATTLNAGDIAFTAYAAANDEFSFVLLRNIGAGTTVNFTTNGWLSTNVFRSGEETITWTSNAAYSAGTEIKIAGLTATLAAGGSAGTVTGTALSMSTTGDQILVYRGTAGAPTFITAIHMNVYSTTAGDAVTTTAAAWDGTANSTNASALPTGLTTGVNCIWIGTQDVPSSEFDNSHYGNCAGPGTLGPVNGLRAALNNQANWISDNNTITPGFVIPTGCQYLGVGSVPNIGTSPSSTSVCAGITATFSITATGATGYQWQVDQGSGFNDLSNNATYSGVNTATLTITSPTVTLNGYQYRCIASNGSGASTSAAATLTVTAVPVAPTLGAKTPASGTVADGTNVSATFNAGSGGTGCSDDFRYTTNGGVSYLPYTPGANISTTGLAAGTGVVFIEGRRANCSAGCQGAYVVLASWHVTPLPAGATTLSAGDIAFSSYAATTDEFSFVLLKNIGVGTTINFTNNGWLSTNVFRTGEESVIWTAPAGGLVAGTEIKIAGLTATKSGGGAAGTVTGTSLGLSITGDQILAFQGSTASPTFISAIHMNVYSTTSGDAVSTTSAAWDGTANTVNSSALPTGLTTGVNAIWIGTQDVSSSEFVNAAYGNCAGPGVLGPLTGLRAALNNQANWVRNNNAVPGFTIPTGCNFLSLLAPTVNVSATLTPFNKCGSTAPPEQTFTVSGSNLTGNITITAPTDFEISTTSGTGFTSSITLTPTSGAVNTTTIYVRLAPAATGTPSGNITVATAGVANTDIPVSGAISAAPTTAAAGADSSHCGLSLNLYGNVPTVGTGTWELVSGAGTANFTNANLATTNVTVSASGTYTLRWVISNGGACPVSADTVVITFTAPPTTAAAGNDGSNCSSSGTWVMNGNNPTSGTGTWSQIAGPLTANIANPSVRSTSVSGMTTAGTYTFVWTISNGAGCPASTDTMNVVINPSPTATITGGNVTVCGSGTILEGPVDPNYTYAWGRSLTSSPYTGVGTGQTLAVTASGSYQLQVTNQFGCPAISTTIVNVADIVFNGSLTAADAQQTGRLNRFGVVSTCASPKACPGAFTTTGSRAYDSYTITNPRPVPVCATIGINTNCGTSAFAVAYSGSFNPTSLCTNYLADPGSSFPTSGFFEATIPANSSIVVVVHEVNPNTGCASYSLTVGIPRDAHSITAVPNTSVCVGTPVSLTANGFANSYLWNPGGATTSTINVTPTDTTQYKVTYSYGNNGCTAVDSFTVNVNSVPTMDPVPNQAFCRSAATGAINFSSTATGTTYSWTNSNPAIGLAASGNGDIPSFVATNNTTAPISATITVTPTLGTCPGTPVTFTIYVAPEAVINSVTNDSVCSPGGVVNLAANGTGAISWYDALTGGNLVNTGATYSPNITGNVTYYVESSVPATPEQTTTMPGQSGTFPGNTRGYMFTAPVDFVITSLQVPTDASSGSQSIAVVKFNGNVPPPIFSASTNAFTTLFLTQNSSISGNIPVNIPIQAGEVIGILASRANINSYAPTGSSITIDGNNVGLTRLGMQFVLSTTNPRDIWQEPGGNISRVNFTYALATCTNSPRTAVTGTILPLPTATATPDTQSVCSGAITPIVLTSNLTGTTFAWTRDNTANVTGIAASGTGDITGTLTNNTTVTQTVTFTITPTSADGCSGTPIIAKVTVQAVPTIVCPANITDNTTTGQCGKIITYSPTVTGIPTPALTYTFTGATTGSGSGNGSGSFFNKGTTTVSITATNACGTANCSFTVTIVDNEAPAITCPAPVTVSCASAVPAVNIAGVTFSDNCPGTVITHVSDVISGQTCTNRYTLTRTYRATDAAGNTTDCAQIITVNDVTPPTLTCPAPVTVSCASAVPPVNVLAVTGVSDNCGGPVTVTHISDVISNQTCPNRYTVTRTYRATDACGNFTECTQIITVNDQTPPALTCPGPITVCGPAAVPAANTALVTGVSDNCGGTVTVTHVGDVNNCPSCVNTPYTITRTYRATDACGNFTECTQTITVNPIPTVDVVNNQILCNTFSTTAVNFTSPVSGTTYSWTNNTTSIGLAASGNGNIPSFTATNTGSAPVTATITVTPTANGCPGPVRTFTITVNPTPNTNAVSNQVLCNGSPTTLVTFTGAVTGTTFNWTNNTTSIGLAASGNGNIPSFNATNTTNAPVTATIAVTPVANGCTGATTNFTITVNPTPTVNVVSNQALCNGQQTTAINFAGPVAGTTYSWTNNTTSIGLAASGNGNIPAFNAVNTGTTPVIATISVTPTANGCPGPVRTFTITVNPSPVVTLAALTPICGNAPAFTLTGGSPSGTGGIYFVDGVPQTSFNPANYTPGVHTVLYQFTNIYGCANTAVQNITVYPVPVSNFTINASGQCFLNNLFVFTNTSTGAVSYSWNFGDATTSTAVSPTKSYAAAGTYTVTLTVTSVNGCVQSFSRTVTVYPQPTKPVVVPEFGNGIHSSIIENTYTWYLNGNVIANTNNRYFYPQTAGYYQVQVTTSFGCSTRSDSLYYIPEKNFTVGLDRQFAFVYPIPAKDDVINIHFNVPTRSAVNFTLYTIKGQILLTGVIPIGTRTYNIDVRRYPSAVYVLRMTDVDNMTRGVVIPMMR